MEILRTEIYIYILKFKTNKWNPLSWGFLTACDQRSHLILYFLLMHPFRKHIPTHKHMYAHIRSLTRSRTHASSLGNIPPQLVAQFLLFLICFSHTRHSTSVSFQSSSLYYGNPSSLGNIPPQLVARIKLKRKLNKTLGWYRKAGKKEEV